MPNDRIVYGLYTWNFVQIQGRPASPVPEAEKAIKMPGYGVRRSSSRARRRTPRG